MIRPFRAETERYGHYSVAGEFVYDRPFQFGSKRTGPDLAPRRRPLQRRMASRAPDQSARRGARVEHAGLSVAGRATSMPTAEDKAKMRNPAHARRPVHRRGDRRRAAAEVEGKTEMDAMIAYLQGLGTNAQERR